MRSQSRELASREEEILSLQSKGAELEVAATSRALTPQFALGSAQTELSKLNELIEKDLSIKLIKSAHRAHFEIALDVPEVRDLKTRRGKEKLQSLEGRVASSDAFAIVTRTHGCPKRFAESLAA